jgi:hypothetical protein
MANGEEVQRMASPAEALEVEEASPERGREILDNAARKYLDMSGDEFSRRWAAGEFEQDDRPEVTHVAMLLPFGG